jgi:translocator protein
MEYPRLRSYFNLAVTLLSLTGIFILYSNSQQLKILYEISNRSSENLMLPPKFSFVIWGIIYVTFLFYSLYQLLPSQIENPRLRRTETYINYSIVLNFLWLIFMSVGLPFLSYLLLWLMLGLALLNLFIYGIPHSTRPLVEQIIFAAFAIYTGWLIVLIIPFTTDLLLLTSWRGEPLSPTLFVMLLYILAAVVCYSSYRELHHLWIIAPLIWIYIGYAIKFSGILSWSATVLAIASLTFFVLRLVQSIKIREMNTVFPRTRRSPIADIY